MIVALHGPAGSGKSTLAAAFEAHGFRSLCFAAPIKRICAEVWGFTAHDLDGPSAAREAVDPAWGITPRKALQTLGSEWGRALHPDVWVVAWARAFQRLPRGDVVVPDMRFPNEDTFLRSLGAQMVLVEAEPSRAIVRAHESENGLPGPWHWTVPWTTPADRRDRVARYLDRN